MQVTLTVTMDSMGKVNVSGPIHEKVLCLGLLEIGKQLVLSYDPGRVRPATSGEVPPVPRVTTGG